MSTNAGIDIVITTTDVAYTTVLADTVTGYTVAADLIHLDISDLTLSGTGAGITVNGAGTVGITGALAVLAVTLGTATTLGAATEALILTGTFADQATLLTAIGGGGTAITWQANPTAGVGLIVVWNDATTTYVSKVSDADTADNTAMLAAELSAVTLIKLTGVYTAFVDGSLTSIA